MNEDHYQKVKAGHLTRNAYLYIRQSTLRQVFENTESTQRQYALRQRAIGLGWPTEQITLIDEDQGQSGKYSAGREGFQRLVGEVGMGQAGIVMGLEVSRLARNNADWHRLLEICALTDTLILDEDGLYDPGHINDRLLLGLKGSFSEVELHVLKARLLGGIRSKARRGELRLPLPIGLVYDEHDRVILDPDQQIQQAIRGVFQTYQRTGSATATVRYFVDQKLRFPRRVRRGPHKGQVIWGPLTNSRVLFLLHNPRYAGAFAFGRSRWTRRPDGNVQCRRVPPDQWQVLIPSAHPGYIHWSDYQENQRRLKESARAYGRDRCYGPPREGSALLQGLVICGVCGQRMSVRYYSPKTRTGPCYYCMRQFLEYGGPKCQTISGAAIDRAVAELLLATITPVSLEVAWAVQQELQTRQEQADHLRLQQVERARYQAELAQQRYMKVDPNNRLVADELEADWNEKLRALTEAQRQYEQQRQKDRTVLEESTKAQVLSLATDLPRLWRDPTTTWRDRKRLIRLVIEDVTLIKDRQITVHVRFKGGACQTLTFPTPLPSWALRKTKPEVIAEIDRLLDHQTDAEIAVELNRRGYRPGLNHEFTPRLVGKLRLTYGLKSRYERLRQAGKLTPSELAQRLGVAVTTVKTWREHGLLQAHRYNDKNQFLYEPVDCPGPLQRHGITLAERRQWLTTLPNRPNEV